MSIEQACIDFNASGTPVARHFDDVYFSNEGGLDETYYVFLKGNGLPARWQQHPHAHFVIAETGFGTGLNFLLSLQHFAAFRQQYIDAPLQHLYFLSCEKFPLTVQDLSQALSHFPTLEQEASALLAQYPIAMAGCHRLTFPNWNCTLDLWFGDVADSLPAWSGHTDGCVDAWYLDGFAPSKNPDMWQPALYDQMARLSRPYATVATFTAAGQVRRGLEAAGFAMKREKGFGRKREMLTGTVSRCALPSKASPCINEVAVIGAGIAAATLVDQLCRMGIRTRLYSAADNWADAASGNIQAGFYPQLHVEASPASLIQAASFMHARRYYLQLFHEGFSFEHDFCGVLQLGFNATQRERIDKLITSANWPHALAQGVSPLEASEIANVSLPYPALWLPLGGWLSPKSLIAALANRAQSTGLLTTEFSYRLNEWENAAHGVTCHFDNGVVRHHRHVIVAIGADAIDIPQLASLPLRVVRGQVEHISTQPSLAPLRTVICHKGYLTPGHQGLHALGSTYNKGERDTRTRLEDSLSNVEMHKSVLEQSEWLTRINHDGQARASVRLAFPDHLPAIGAYDDNGVSVLLGLGSRGFTTAPLMASLLLSELTHRPLPLHHNLSARLHVQRWRT